jgi:hypothetical protein
MTWTPQIASTVDAHGFRRALETEFQKHLFGNDFINTTLDLKCNYDEIASFVSELIVHQFSKNECVFYNDTIMIQCEHSGQSNHVSLEIMGRKDVVDLYYAKLIGQFNASENYIKWVYDPQYLESMNVPIPEKNPPFEEMYPWLKGESLVSYYDRFIKSDSNILLLVGPPGNGKTSFVRDLLRKTKQNAIVTYHPKVLEQESFFAQWYQSRDENIVVAEDADEILAPRSEGNKLMQRFLNLGDGLISITGKKIIFTCNLPNISDIDPALSRPGRCFDVVKFDPLNREESLAVAKRANINFSLSGNQFTISEIFNEKSKESVRSTKNKFGFV